MKLVLISDTHEMHEQVTVPDGDVLIHAGDYTFNGHPVAKERFMQWFKAQPHKHKVLVAGNHDFDEPEAGQDMGDGVHYLFDSAVELDGLKVWGSPYTPVFFDWAFMYPRGTKRWQSIPKGSDVVITHGPAWGILDRPFGRQPSVGCADLLDALMEVRPKVHVAGHIHGGYGSHKINGTQFFNASVVNEAYKVVNRPWVVEL